MEIVIAVLNIIIAVTWIFLGVTQYGFWSGGKPQGGFVPIIFAILVLVFTLVIVFRLMRKTIPVYPIKINWDAATPVFSAIGGVVLILLFGIAPAVFLFNFGWMRFISKYSLKRSIFVSLIFTLFVYAVFRLWLRVPFPIGIVMELL